jgi:hypothetical protein
VNGYLDGNALYPRMLDGFEKRVTERRQPAVSRVASSWIDGVTPCTWDGLPAARLSARGNPPTPQLGSAAVNCSQALSQRRHAAAQMRQCAMPAWRSHSSAHRRQASTHARRIARASSGFS